jgi:TATA-box binding protein (TBP) (component of TFIID and TFIIIB)
MSAAASSVTPFKATPLRISTMTATGDLGAIPDLRRLYSHPHILPYWWIGEGILKVEFAGERKGECMEDILHVTTKQKKRFFNQSSLVFRLARPDGPPQETSDAGALAAGCHTTRYKETSNAGELATGCHTTRYKETSDAGALAAGCHTTRYKEINIKLFKNGGFQMTGINSEEMARAALTRLIAQYRDIWPADANPHIKKFDTCLMNSDYGLDKAIHRDNLYHVLVEEYGLWSTYDPTRYQGVNAKFFWNKARPAGAPPGICLCPTPCSGEGAGYAIGECKKITIAPFRTGKIIITGAKFMEQLEDAYSFINGVFAKHAAAVLREPTPDVPAAAPSKSKKTPAPLDTPATLIRQRMRASPRNIVRLPMATAVNPTENIPAGHSE